MIDRWWLSWCQEVSDIMVGCGMVATIQTDWETARTPFVLFRYIVNRRKQDRAYFYTSFFHSLWKQFKICYVILALSLCKNMWKPEMLVREFVSLLFSVKFVYFYFYGMWFFDKNSLSLGISSAWNRELRWSHLNCPTVRRVWREKWLPDSEKELSENTVKKFSVPKLKLLLHEEL